MSIQKMISWYALAAEFGVKVFSPLEEEYALRLAIGDVEGAALLEEWVQA